MAAKIKVKRSSPALPGASPSSGMGSVQLGQSGLKRSYGYIYEELLPQLQGRKAISVYQEMSQNSSVVGGMLFAIDMFMRKVAWRVEAASDSDADKAKAKYLESCKDDMEHTWADFVAEVNTMLVFGWSWFEIVYKQRFNDVVDEFGTTQSQWNDGLVGWQKFMPIAQESWWRWDFDPASGKTIGMWQRPAPDYSERYLPIGKSLHFRTTSRKDNPEGVSILRAAYRAWYFLKRIEEIEAIGVERDLAGIPIATVPAEMLGDNASDDAKAMVAAIAKLVQNVRRDEQEGIVWPQAYDEAGHELYKFNLLTSGGTRQFPTDTIINRYETRIAMTALADFLLLGNDASSGGSYALATSKSSMFQSALETWLNGVESIMNDRAVPLLFRANGINSGPYPKFRHDIVQKPTLTDLATLISAMAGAGAQLFPDTDLENHLREFAELPARESNDKDRATELKIIQQQLETLLAESESQEALADRTGKDASAEGVSGMPVGSIAAPVSPVVFKPPAGGAAGGASGSASGTPAASQNPSAATAAGTGGKQPGSKKGAPTKSTGPVKSTQPPRKRRTTISTRAGQNAPAKTTGGAKTRSVAKGKKSDSARGRVMRQMSQDFPQSSMEWMHEVPWKGPVEVPIDSINFSDAKEWATNHEPGKVEHFAREISGGHHKPVVLAKTPGNDKYDIIDGHHHAMAYRETGIPPLAYIAKVPDDQGPWTEMHSSQEVNSGSGYEPGDKGGQKKLRLAKRMPIAGGVAVRAADTGRVLMLQRGLDANDPASGKWEFPGGCRDSLKESPEHTGIREWQEETGMKIPKGKLTGHWIAGNGAYHGVVLTVPHEAALPITGDRSQVSNPDDPDGDKVESLAWWDPKHLTQSHPAIRRELRDSLPDVHRAIRSREELPLQKSTGVAMVPFRSSGYGKDAKKKCDYCQNNASRAFIQKSTGSVLARCCQTHVPAARAEIRWSQNNQVSPNNPMPYEPFPRVVTQ